MLIHNHWSWCNWYRWVPALNTSSMLDCSRTQTHAVKQLSNKLCGETCLHANLCYFLSLLFAMLSTLESWQNTTLQVTILCCVSSQCPALANWQACLDSGFDHSKGWLRSLLVFFGSSPGPSAWQKLLHRAPQNRLPAWQSFATAACWPWLRGWRLISGH